MEKKNQENKSNGSEIIDEYAGLVLEKYPIINYDIKDIDLSLLKSLKPGTYRINGIPSVELLQELPFYKGTEVGILCIHNQWLIILGEQGVERIGLPDELKKVAKCQAFQISMHSHPSDPSDEYDDTSYYPSFSDLFAGQESIDGFHYIISSHGITQFSIKNREAYIILDYRPENDGMKLVKMVVIKDGYPILNHEVEYVDLIGCFQSYTYNWAEQNGKEYFESKSEAYIPFLKNYFDIVLIPYENKIIIEEILNKSNNDYTTNPKMR